MKIRIFAVHILSPINEEIFSFLLNYCDRHKINKISNKKQKDLTLAGSILARYAINKAFKIPFKEIEFTYNEWGKPEAKKFPNIHFNISHSGEYIVCAVSDKLIGIDIQEKYKLNYDAFAKRYFNAQELKQFNKSKNKQDIFFSIWTQKESYLKAVGKGITAIFEPYAKSAQFCFSDSIDGYKICLCLLK